MELELELEDSLLDEELELEILDPTS